MKFSYRAFDRAGAPKSGGVEAPSAAEGTELLRRQGLFILEIRPAEETAASGPARHPQHRRASRKQVAAFMRHLSVLVTTGTPIVDALSALERQASDVRWRSLIADVRSRVEDGAPFSEALAAHPRSFDTICRSLVRAGESGGKLDVMLSRLADLTRRQVKIRQTLIGAMVYPALLIIVAVAVLTTMLVFVMPRFAGLFKTLDAPLPPTTEVLMSISGFAIHWWWLLLLVLGGLVSGIVAYTRSAHGRLAMFTLAIRAPQIGRICRAFATARFSRLMGLLLESKVPMLECLELTRNTSVNAHYAALMDHIHTSLTRGEPFSAALSHNNLISPSVCEAVKNAERTGQVGPVLSSMADFLDEENEVLLKSITSLIEPLILITLGLVVGCIAISMFLPLFDLTATAGGGTGAGAGGSP